MKAAKVSMADIDSVVLVGGSTRIPYVQTLLKKHLKIEKLNKQVNPDEAVALGAAIQGAIISGHAKDGN